MSLVGWALPSGMMTIGKALGALGMVINGSVSATMPDIAVTGDAGGKKTI